MKISKERVREIIREEIQMLTEKPYTANPNKQFYQGFSSREAKNVIDKELKLWAKDLRKVQYRVIKSWMSKAKAGVIDYFDLVRGLDTGDIARAHPYETKFFKALIDKDKIMNRFRSYFGGKKGKPGYRGPR